MPKSFLTAIFTLLMLLPSFATDPPAKPPIKLAEDGLPAGSDTPEGAACDLARAFIHHDSALFLATCIKPYGGAEAKKAYEEFLDGVVAQMKEEAKKTDPSPCGPKSIGKCFAARHLSKSGPASYGYASFGFQDIMFVDVGVYLQNGTTQLCRTLTIKDKQGKWIVHPRPDLSPLLSMGLNDEAPSEQDFLDAYSTK
jgi:hypothetical protein